MGLQDVGVIMCHSRPAPITQGAPWGPNETIWIVGYHKLPIVVGLSLGWVIPVKLGQDDTGGSFEGFSAKKGYTPGGEVCG